MRIRTSLLWLPLFCTLGCDEGGGGSAPPDPQRPAQGPALASSVPAQGGVLASRWSPVRLTFSRPIAAGARFTSTCPGMTWSQAAAEVVGTFDPSAPPPLGATCTVSGRAKAADGTDGEAFSFSFGVPPAKTVISADIVSPTTLTVAGSPYLIEPSKAVRVVDAVLTLEPGVELEGTLTIAGTASVVAAGTETARIHVVGGGFVTEAAVASSHTFRYVDFHAALDDLVTSGAIEISHATFHCGGTPGWQHLVSVGSGAMTDSRMIGCAGVRARNAVFERNVVLGPADSQIVDPRIFYASFSSFSNNHVEGFGLHGAAYATQRTIQISDAASLGRCRGNSFVGFGSSGIQGSGAGLSGAVDLSGNWWGTTDTGTIQTYLADSRDDAQLPYTFVVEPVLAAPDPATPTP